MYGQGGEFPVVRGVIVRGQVEMRTTFSPSTFTSIDQAVKYTLPSVLCW